MAAVSSTDGASSPGAFWGPPADPQFFGGVELDAAALLDYVRQVRETTGTHVTMTHAIGRAVAHGLEAVPDLQVRLAHGREYPREQIDIFFIVTPDGGELTGCRVDHVNEKSMIEVAEELTAGRRSISHGSDDSFGRAKRLLDLMPSRLLPMALRISSWLTSDLNLDLPGLGVRRQAFGSAMITSVGMWGIPRAYSPLADFYRVPVLVLVGAVTQRPVAIAGQVVIRPMLTLTATLTIAMPTGCRLRRSRKRCRGTALILLPSNLNPGARMLPLGACPRCDDQSRWSRRCDESM